MDSDLGRFWVTNPGRRGCRRHHWVIDSVELDGQHREQWSCSVCGRQQWRDPLAPAVAKKERYSRWSTVTAEDLWEADTVEPADGDSASGSPD
jgi:hypothetical protein